MCFLLLFKNFSKCLLNGVNKTADLDKACHDTQIQAYSDDTDHGGYSPDETVYRAVDFGDQFKHKYSAPR